MREISVGWHHFRKNAIESQRIQKNGNKCEIVENYYVNIVTNFKVDLQLSARVYIPVDSIDLMLERKEKQFIPNLFLSLFFIAPQFFLLSCDEIPSSETINVLVRTTVWICF